MLVLSRKRGEKIYIGEDIVLEVVHIQPGFIRIGILAPKETKILRSELVDNKEDAKKEKK